MGIEYTLDLGCPPKAALNHERIVALLKGQSQAKAIIEMSRRRGDQRPPEQLSFTSVVMRPSGPVKEEINVGTLLKKVQALQPYARHCEGCKANLLGKPFGCYGSVSYPISARAEEWLMSLLPEDLNCPAGHLLRSAVADLKYDGGMFLTMRPKAMFMESRTPIRRKWGSGTSGWTLTSDQLLQMIFGLGNLLSFHCKNLSIILGLIQLGEEFRPLPPVTPNDQTEQMAQAVSAVGLASRLGVNLLIDA